MKRLYVILFLIGILVSFQVNSFSYPKKLKKAEVLIRSEKEVSLLGKKVFVASSLNSNELSERDKDLRDNTFKSVLSKCGAEIVYKEEEADYILFYLYEVSDLSFSTETAETTHHSFSNPLYSSLFWNSFYRFNPDNNSQKRYDTSIPEMVYQYQEEPSSIQKQYRKTPATKRVYTDKWLRYSLMISITSAEDNSTSLWNFQSVILSSSKYRFIEVLPYMILAAEDYFGRQIGSKFKKVTIRSSSEGLQIER